MNIDHVYYCHIVTNTQRVLSVFFPAVSHQRDLTRTTKVSPETPDKWNTSMKA